MNVRTKKMILMEVASFIVKRVNKLFVIAVYPLDAFVVGEEQLIIMGTRLLPQMASIIQARTQQR